ncbi:MAG: stage II sporulation protein R [Bacillota bacterium]|nr:stage II sporulation protein R [Bacillota bacterium]
MRRKFGALLLLGFISLASFIAIQGDLRAKRAYTRDNLIRLHVIANSDDEQDQAVKYRVRDALIDYLKPDLRKSRNSEEAKACLNKSRAEIARIAAQTVAASGFSYPVRVEMGKFTFPARAYGDVVYPAGQYEAVRVVLGKGEGTNWWCVLFPPLCFVDLSSTGDQTFDINEGIRETLAQDVRGRDAGELRNNQTDAGQDVFDLRLRVWDWLQNEANHLARLISS